ncbi:Uncharacterised protein [Mycobacterium tuberculosis]|uniref:Uncharacterized protein n=2 Tax=Mycobacterium tuberculosis TaxID=1773 RepID=A0A655AM80_MYCTX|nr:Uncharacterised protein [Mycobacterium tuberculosis]CKT15178.1 Uncharacterised protein [Mycobacterium tuberculosis]CKT65329.1 Uncharacterised protein [Mycobacterium tuberculosis]COY47801.1 Uncharacterised protein [Mycobacterium tuberculosis]
MHAQQVQPGLQLTPGRRLRGLVAAHMRIDCERTSKPVPVYEQIVGHTEDFGQLGHDVLVGVTVA